MSSSFPDSLDQFTDESSNPSYLGPYAFSNVAGSQPPIEVTDPEDFSSEMNTNEPILPPPAEMEPEEGEAVREWRRSSASDSLGINHIWSKKSFTWFSCKVSLNLSHIMNEQNEIRLEEKERMERELLSKIILEADEYKVEFHRKRQVITETNKATNREKEEVFVAIQDKFYAEADKDYWNSIGELIPKEVPTIETRKGKKDQEKNTSTFVVKGPKPGKPTDLTRMRQMLLKLKHDTPPHLKPSVQSAPDATTNAPVAVASSSEAVIVV